MFDEMQKRTEEIGKNVVAPVEEELRKESEKIDRELKTTAAFVLEQERYDRIVASMDEVREEIEQARNGIESMNLKNLTEEEVDISIKEIDDILEKAGNIRHDLEELKNDLQKKEEKPEESVN